MGRKERVPCRKYCPVACGQGGLKTALQRPVRPHIQWMCAYLMSRATLLYLFLKYRLQALSAASIGQPPTELNWGDFTVHIIGRDASTWCWQWALSLHRQ